MTDPIADMLTRIRNAIHAEKERVEMPSSRMKVEIARVLKEQGYIADYSVAKKGRFAYLTITLKWTEDGSSVISGLRRVSKPGRRVYVRKDEIPRVMGGLGVAILSTSRGVMSGLECRRLGVGGELLATVW